MKNARRIFSWIRHEAVLSIAFVCAAASAVFIPPDRGYAEYIDFRVLGTLFSLMAAVSLLQLGGAFRILAQKMLSGEKSTRRVFAELVLLPYFGSMLITNDVALLSFVPFAVLVLTSLGRTDALGRIVVLQTLAANLGSMATPVGNPQNLFLFSHYSLTAGDFFRLILPFAALSVFLLLPALWDGAGTVQINLPAEAPDRKKLLAGCGLFVLCLAGVLRLVYWPWVAGTAAALLFGLDKRIFRRIDWALLATFVCFFIFSGNLGRMAPVRGLLEELMQKNALFAAAAASQVISNVPAAVLLAPMTENWRAMLLGTDIGGLGTPVASLASLIALKLYAASPGARVGRYLLFFTGMNLLGLLLLLPLAALVG